MALRVRDLTFAHDGAQVMVRGWSQDFPAGPSLLLGDEGSGKTTLLRLLAGELTPRSGGLQLVRADALAGAGADPVEALDASDSAAWRRQVFWHDPNGPWADGDDRVSAWAMAAEQAHPGWSRAAWQRHVAGFGLAPHLDKTLHQLSTGSRRKVLLAAALASGAPLTLIDEPVAALDRASITYLCQALAQHARTPPGEARVLLVAHYDSLGDLPWRRVVPLPG